MLLKLTPTNKESIWKDLLPLIEDENGEAIIDATVSLIPYQAIFAELYV